MHNKRNSEVLLLIDNAPASRYRGIARLARERGWNLTIEDKRTPPPSYRWDGCLVMTSPNNKPLLRFVRELRKRGVPFVDIALATPQLVLPRVCADNRQMGRLAAEHFRQHRFSRAVFFALHWGNVQKLRYEGFTERGGYRDALRIIGDELTDSRNDYRARLAKAITDLPKPIGVFAYNDYDATRVLNACRAKSILVPDEVAILGVDDDALLCESQSIPLSSIRHPHEATGYEAAALLDKMMSGERPPASPRLIAPLGIAVRQSTDIMASDDPLVRQVLRIIKSNLSGSLNTPGIARLLGVRPSQLSRAFRAKMGHTLANEVIRQRLSAARRMIAERAMKLEAVARETGFCSAAHLTNAFKKIYGQSPREWRNTLRPAETASPTDR